MDHHADDDMLDPNCPICAALEKLQAKRPSDVSALPGGFDVVALPRAPVDQDDLLRMLNEMADAPVPRWKRRLEAKALRKAARGVRTSRPR